MGRKMASSGESVGELSARWAISVWTLWDFHMNSRPGNFNVGMTPPASRAHEPETGPICITKSTAYREKNALERPSHASKNPPSPRQHALNSPTDSSEDPKNVPAPGPWTVTKPAVAAQTEHDLPGHEAQVRLQRLEESMRTVEYFEPMQQALQGTREQFRSTITGHLADAISWRDGPKGRSHDLPHRVQPE
jgi:hypothetical protein